MNGSPEPIQSTELKALWKALDTKPAVVFRALGTSMRPLYPSGTLFLLEAYRNQTLSVGDLVLVEINGDAILHRIVQIKGRPPHSITLKGDAKPYPEGPYPLASVRAIATHTIENTRLLPLKRGLKALRANSIARISYFVGLTNRILRKVGIR